LAQGQQQAAADAVGPALGEGCSPEGAVMSASRRRRKAILRRQWIKELWEKWQGER
jgi:hypothetical protein